MKNKTKKFDDALEQFKKGKDPVAHHKAIRTLLSGVELDEHFWWLLDEKEDGVRDFFLLWGRAGKEEENPQERKGFKKIGESSKKLYEQKEYRKLCEFFYNILFRHLAEFIHLEEHKDFDTITDYDLYKKDLIPSEIYFQYFLIEVLVKSKDFDWDRGEEIANQNLACFIACFDDIYEFFHEEEEKSEGKPIAFVKKIGRNEPCRCGSGVKSKKCCEK